MSTVQENLLPSAMVPGLITIEDSKGNRQNVYPIDAKELIAQGKYKLVENGAIEAARMAATPLRSGMASGIPSDQIVAEVSGVEGRIVAAASPEEAQEIIASGDSADANSKPSAAPPGAGFDQVREGLATSTAGTAGTRETNGKTPDPDARPPAKEAATKPAAKGDDNK